MSENQFSAQLWFYRPSFQEILKFNSNKNPLRISNNQDIVCIEPIEKEDIKPAKRYELKGRIHFKSDRELRAITQDFASRYGTEGAGWQSWNDIYEIHIPIVQRGIIISAFVNYFSK